MYSFVKGKLIDIARAATPKQENPFLSKHKPYLNSFDFEKGLSLLNKLPEQDVNIIVPKITDIIGIHKKMEAYSAIGEGLLFYETLALEKKLNSIIPKDLRYDCRFITIKPLDEDEEKGLGDSMILFIQPYKEYIISRLAFVGESKVISGKRGVHNAVKSCEDKIGRILKNFPDLQKKDVHDLFHAKFYQHPKIIGDRKHQTIVEKTLFAKQKQPFGIQCADFRLQDSTLKTLNTWKDYVDYHRQQQMWNKTIIPRGHTEESYAEFQKTFNESLREARMAAITRRAKGVIKEVKEDKAPIQLNSPLEPCEIKQLNHSFFDNKIIIADVVELFSNLFCFFIFMCLYYTLSFICMLILIRLFFYLLDCISSIVLKLTIYYINSLFVIYQKFINLFYF